MKAVCAIALGGLFVAGCGGSSFGLAAGNRKPSLTVLDPTSQPDTTSGVVLTPDIADEKPGSCTVDWILYVWDGDFAGGEPSLTQVQTAQTTGEAAVTFSGLPSGWYTVDVTVRDDDGETYTVSKWDFTNWCSSNGFGQCALLPVANPSDSTPPVIDVTEVVLKGRVTDVGLPTGNITSLTRIPAGTVNLATTGGPTSDFDATIDCPGTATSGSDVVTTVTFTATDVDANTSQKEVIITEHLVP